MNPDRLAELEEERRFLLRSITDLERERAAGDVDDHDFASLHDGYVARAATVLRSIEAGRAAVHTRRRQPRKTAMWVVATVAVASLAGWMVAHFSGQRTASSAGAAAQPADEVVNDLADVSAALSRGDVTTAINAYQQVLEIDPTNAEATTYTGWLLVISGAQQESGVAIDAGLGQLRKAVAADPSYADAHCLLAVTLAKYAAQPDLDGARHELDACLASNPPASVRELVEGLRVELEPTTSST